MVSFAEKSCTIPSKRFRWWGHNISDAIVKIKLRMRSKPGEIYRTCQDELDKRSNLGGGRGEGGLSGWLQSSSQQCRYRVYYRQLTTDTSQHQLQIWSMCDLILIQHYLHQQIQWRPKLALLLYFQRAGNLFRGSSLIGTWSWWTCSSIIHWFKHHQKSGEANCHGEFNSIPGQRWEPNQCSRTFQQDIQHINYYD